MPWRGGTLCQAVLEAVESAGCRPILVAGYRAGELAATFANRPGLAIVINEDWQLGMLGSILAGATLVTGPGFLVAPADMPFLPASVFQKLTAEAKRLEDQGEKPAAIFASHNGALGHPVWIPTEFLPEIKTLPPEARLREYLLTQRWIAVEAGTDAVLIDIDLPAEYEQASALLQ